MSENKNIETVRLEPVRLDIKRRKEKLRQDQAELEALERALAYLLKISESSSGSCENGVLDDLEIEGLPILDACREIFRTRPEQWLTAYDVANLLATRRFTAKGRNKKSLNEQVGNALVRAKDFEKKKDVQNGKMRNFFRLKSL
jgi:hypothetical protein